MFRITESFASKVCRYGVVDTRLYRYVEAGNYKTFTVINRIALDALDTTEALHAKSDLYPNGWDSVVLFK